MHNRIMIMKVIYIEIKSKHAHTKCILYIVVKMFYKKDI